MAICKIRHFKDLRSWQEAHALVLKIYKITNKYPTNEKYSLITQMRRCAVSIAANIAEGFKRYGLQDKIHFYNIAQGSLSEAPRPYPALSIVALARRKSWVERNPAPPAIHPRPYGRGVLVGRGELHYYTILSNDLGYIDNNRDLEAQITLTSKLLTGLIKSAKNITR